MIGVGLNLSIAPDEFPPELREPATSLFAAGIGKGRGRGAAPPTPRPQPQLLSRHLDRWVVADESGGSRRVAPRATRCGPRGRLGGGKSG